MKQIVVPEIERVPKKYPGDSLVTMLVIENDGSTAILQVLLRTWPALRDNEFELVVVIVNV